MSPERMTRLVGRWVRLYTRRLPAEVAQRRIDEIDADLHDHVAHEREQGTSDRRIALGLGSRMLRGLPADAAWRGQRARAATTYRFGVALAVWTALFMFWLMGAVGIIGVEGDPADLLYLGVFAVGIVGAVAGRFRPLGMARALLAVAVALALVSVVAIVAGKHEDPVTSIPELLGLNGFFIALFLGAAWLFRDAARKQAAADGSR